MEARMNEQLTRIFACIRKEYKDYLGHLLNQTSDNVPQYRTTLQNGMVDSTLTTTMEYCNHAISVTQTEITLTLCVRPDFWHNTSWAATASKLTDTSMQAMSAVYMSYNFAKNDLQTSYMNEFGCRLQRHLTLGKSHQLDFSRSSDAFVAVTAQAIAQLGQVLVLKAHMGGHELYSFVCKDIQMHSPNSFVEWANCNIMWCDTSNRRMCVLVLLSKPKDPTCNLEALRLILDGNDLSITTLDTIPLHSFIPTNESWIKFDPLSVHVAVAPSGERVLITTSAEDDDVSNKLNKANMTNMTNMADMSRMYGWMIDYGLERKRVKSFYPHSQNYHNLMWHTRGISMTLKGGSLLFDMPPTKACMDHCRM